SIKLKF
ncbi:unnamed protein product, partial [Callosobruchus maculatus]